MEITTGLVAKVGGGLSLLGAGATGIYLGHDYLSNYLSIYDRALIDFLRDDEANDIIFEVKKGDESADLGADDLNFSNNNQTPTIKVKVAANTSTANNIFKKGSKSEGSSNLDAIKKLGKEESGWIWECSFNFTAEGEGASSKAIKEDYKKRIWKDASLGLFGLLKKDTTAYTDPTTTSENKWTKEEIKQVKIDFIEKCGHHRGKSKNKEINWGKAENNDIKVGEIPIVFKIESDNLIPKDKAVFDHWFIRDEDKDKAYNTTSES